MILSRVIEHVKKQHWTAVFLDFIIVVFGVFLGIQLGNWNEARSHHAEERAFLAQMRDEISDSLDVLHDQSLFVDEVIASGRRALAYLEGGEDCKTDCENLLIDFFQASQIWGTAIDYTMYSEALRLGFPSNLQTRKAVGAYYQYIDGVQSLNGAPPAFRERVRGYFTPEASAMLWRSCHGTKGAQIEVLTHDCAGELAKLDAAAMLHDIRADKKLMPELKFWIGQNIPVRQLQPEIRAKAEALLAAINAEIGDGE